MPHHTETEFKLRATRPIEVASIDATLREVGLRCQSTDSIRHADTYLDDAQGSLAAAGIGLRLREDRRGSRVGCKTRGQRNGALFVREEHEAPWPTAAVPQTARELPPALRDMVEPFVLDRTLVPVLRLETQRESRMLQGEERELCELMIDQATAHAAGRSATFLEVEIEVLDDLPSCERLAERMANDLPLAAATDDKPTHAAILLGIPRPERHPTAVSATSPTGEAIAAITAQHLQQLCLAEVGVRTDSDPAQLHSMRVSLRRLRSLVRAFRDLWRAEDSAWILDHLAAAGRELGALRDLDVMVENLPAAVESLPLDVVEAGRRVVEWVANQRATTHAGVHEWLRSAPRLAAATQLRTRLAAIQSDTTLAAQPLVATVAPRLAKASAQLRKLAAGFAPDMPLEPLHELRIAGKRLRYLAEEFRELPDHDHDQALKVVTRLQQTLGIVCDHELAAHRLLAWVKTAAGTLDDGALAAAALGGLATMHTELARKARKAAAKRLERVDRKKVWRQFHSTEPTDAIVAE